MEGENKEELMERAIDAASNIKDDTTRTEALHIVLSNLKNLPMNNLYFLWRKTFQILVEYTRRSLLVDIITLLPVINDIGKDETFFEISKAIIYVSRWWP